MSYNWLNTESRNFLASGYLSGGETAEQRISDIGYAAQKLLCTSYSWKKGNENKQLPERYGQFAAKFIDYMSRGFYSLASPIWANFGKERGLPVSCYSSYIDDTCDSILFSTAEVGKMTQVGGGTSGYFGAVRPRGSSISHGGESEGAVSFMKMFDTSANVMKQSSVRRGSFAAYLPIDHGDIEEFLNIRTEGNDIQSILTGVCIKDEWMEEMIAGDEDKRRIWGLVLKRRSELGVPYLSFYDNINNNAPQSYKDKGKIINSQNLCNEVCLSTDPDESYVCVLSSMNIAEYDQWKDTDAVETLLMFLDAVNEEFIAKTEGMHFMERAVKFAKSQRALGLGVLGWHTYLQKKMIPFGSIKANALTNEIFKLIRHRCDKLTSILAIDFGEPELLEGSGRRNATTMAVAPTKSSSFILGQVSQSIEPWHSNYFISGLAKADALIKNKELTKLLTSKDRNNKDTWKSILHKNGSVQHLDFLTDEEKDVFKTFCEISQLDIINQASIRQQYIDQGQSINLMIHPDCPAREINKLTIEAWKLGLKGLYYQKTFSSAASYNMELMSCSSCEG